jgi:hypothetical protein
MRRIAVVAVFTAIVAAAVWYAVTHLELRESASDDPLRQSTAPAPSSSVGAWPEPIVAACGGRCDVRRWAIKTLSDPDRALVDTTPVAAAIEDLIRIARPQFSPSERRAAPVELTVYRVEARLLYVLGQTDRDIHLVLQSPTNPQATLIGEIPDPECSGSCNSGLASRFASVRAALQRWIATGRQQDPVVAVTGVGFWDSDHGQRGAAPNNLELHPVLTLELR